MTTAEESWTSWLCDLDAGDYSFINESDTNVVDASFPCHEDIVPTSRGSFNTESSSTTASNSSDDGRPAKVLKTAAASTYLSQNKDSSPSSYILSFSNANPSSVLVTSDSDPALKPKGKAVNHGRPLLSADQKKEPRRNVQEGKKSGWVSRSPLHAQDHIIAERLRREKISQQFIALSALIPGLKKMDKASVLGDAIKHVKQLQEQVKLLEEQAKRRSVESVVYVEKSQLSAEEDVSDTSSNSGDGNSYDPSKTNRSLPEVEARVSYKNVLIRIHCEKQKGLLINILRAIENLHLSVINSSALLFGASTVDITITAQMDDDFNMSVKELARNLRGGLLQFM